MTGPTTSADFHAEYAAALSAYLTAQGEDTLAVGHELGRRALVEQISMLEIIKEPEAALTDQVRCISALFTMHAGMFVLKDVEGDPEDKRKAVLEVAIDLVTQAHGGAAGHGGGAS